MSIIETEIKRRAKLFCEDNEALWSELQIETAMLIGASIALENNPLRDTEDSTRAVMVGGTPRA